MITWSVAVWAVLMKRAGLLKLSEAWKDDSCRRWTAAGSSSPSTSNSFSLGHTAPHGLGMTVSATTEQAGQSGVVHR